MTAGSDSRGRRTLAWAIALLLGSAAIYNSNLRYIAAFDSYPASELPFRILQGHGLTLTDPSGLPPGARYCEVRSLRGPWISLYPIVTPLLVLPLYVPVQLIRPISDDATGGKIRVVMEKLSASLVAALSVALLFLVMARISNRRIALLAATAYAFGTSMWTISSQALWQHGTSALLLTITLVLLQSESSSAGRVALVGLVAGLLAANRPTDALFSLAILLGASRRWGKSSWPAWLSAGALGLAVLFYNVRNYGSPIGGYARYYGLGSSEFALSRRGLDGILGILFSNRGLFVFSPLLLLLIGFSWKEKERIPGLKLLLAAAFASLIFHGLTVDWSGGYCYGPRYAIHGLPVLFAALAGPLGRAVQSLTGRLLVGLSLAFAIALQIIGAFFYPGGDSGNSGHPVWSIAKSGPVLAVEAGPRPPDFLGFLLPSFATRHDLSVRDTAAQYDWTRRPPPTVEPAEPVDVGIRITNLSGTSWSSVGGWMNHGAVRVRASWAANGHEVEHSEHWLAWRLAPGRTVLRTVRLRAPRRGGRMLLSLGLTQVGIGPFAAGGGISIPVEVRDPAPNENARAER